MSNGTTSTAESLVALSQDKAKLLELLLDRESRQAQRIQAYPRDAERNAHFPTSSAQQRLWFIDQIEGGGAAYNIATAVRLMGSLDGEALQTALDTIVQRHEVLHSVFVDVEGEPRQHVIPQRHCLLQRVDLSGLEEAARAAEVEVHKRAEASGRFDLHTGPLIRGRILRIASAEHVLLVTLHHIVADGWSMGVLFREFAALYAAYSEGRPNPLEPMAIQYADYVQWQLEELQMRVLQKQLHYWRDRLHDAAQELELPRDRPRPAVKSYRGRRVAIVLDRELTAGLNVLARRHGMTLFMTLCAGWAMLLSRLSNQDDVSIGTPVANRRRAGLEPLIGFFVNTLVLRVQPDGDLPLMDFLNQVKETTLALYDNREAPFEQIVEAVRPPRTLNRHPIFQVMFALQNAPLSTWELPGLTVTLEDTTDETAKFDLLLALEERGGQIKGHLNYDVDILDHETVEQWAVCLQVLLSSMVGAEGGCRIADLPILADRERHQVIELFNATNAAYPRNKLTHQLFEEQVQRTPGAIAVAHEDNLLTYDELNRKANQLGRYLARQGVTAGDYIPVVMARSLSMLVAQLAVLKSGGVYVPIDPGLPCERQAFMIRDCGARVIVAESERNVALGLPDLQWLNCMDATSRIVQEQGDNLSMPDGCVPPAYIMYTSGSTGVPKGVVVPHHAVNRLVINGGYANFEPDDCFAHYSNPAFDASTLEVWGPLLSGARLVIVPQYVVLDAPRFAKVLEEQQVTILYMSVGLFNQYADDFTDVFARLRYLMVGGDSLEPSVIRRVLQRSAPQHLLNVYGPTECTTFATTHLIREVLPDARSIPIGRPMANARAYILDRHRHPVPIGVIGELHIGGAGVASGYLDRPDLTNERFLVDPFASDPSARMYKTGDLCRWRRDGVLEYFGRNDLQVKIRGFRVEPGEIEARLIECPGVKEAVVLARQDEPGEKRLVAYIAVSNPMSAPAIEGLRASLKDVLPEFMVPSAFVILEQMPLNPSGKVDRRALPAPERSAFAISLYEPPQGHVEERIAEIWQKLLGVERVGRNDSFFELGGHSLLVLKALSMVTQCLEITLSVRDVYASPTPKQLALRVRGEGVQQEYVDLAQEAYLECRIEAGTLPRRNPAPNVLLTGASGFVGRFLLAQLLQDMSTTVYCLIRASSKHQASTRLHETLSKWHLWRDDFQSRLIAVPGDLRQPCLGLDEASYRCLCARIDTIYHCATSMNHLETYTLAKPANVEAIRELVKFATQERLKLLNYVSSVSVFSAATCSGLRVVEEITSIDQEKHSTAHGYAASKWVGEKICMIASERGLPCNIFRLGLVWADTKLGRYDDLQRGYRILKSCLLSGCGIENFRHEMPPTPVDYVARAIVFLAEHHKNGQGIFHISSAEQMPDGIFERCNAVAGTSLELLPLYDWTREIKRLHETGHSLPVVPLIESSFGMDQEAFQAQQRRVQTDRVVFDCARTHRELEQGGIIAPALNDDLLERCIVSMLATD